MVGVAKRSKGCGTCRRRKIKCDETKPACTRCKQAGITCEGYQRWPIFIVRTQSGYRRRKPLEEIKVPMSLSHLRPDSKSIEATRYTSWFWETYGTRYSTTSGGRSSSHWLYHFMHCQEPIFNRALLAVSLTAFGKQFERPEATVAGRQLYVLSLKSVRDFTLLTDSIEKDELPATVCTMVLYELLNPSMECSASWLTHLHGLYGLVKHRGPHRHCQLRSRAVLEHCRHLGLIQNLVLRKASLFCLSTWLEEPWHSVTKGFQQLVIDYGLQLTSLYEQCDLALYHDTRPETVADLLYQCIILHGNAQKLYDEQKSLDCMAKFNVQPMPGSSLLAASDTGELMPIVTLLTVQLGACISATQLVNRLSNLPEHTTRTLSQSTQNIMNSASDLGSMAELLARQILAVIQACPVECIGGLDSVMTVYSLSLASQCLTKIPQAMTKCQQFIHLFSARASRFGALLPETSKALA